MSHTPFAREKDTAWMKFADLMVDSGVISDYIEGRSASAGRFERLEE
jgi:hypothetical protein